jgi:hypothetical protein
MTEMFLKKEYGLREEEGRRRRSIKAKCCHFLLKEK